MKTFVITVIQLVPFTELDHEDLDFEPQGIYEREAESEDDALDKFHATIPIACLDDFEITCTEVRR